MKALSAGNYAAATAHFDPTMRAGFNAVRIESMWQRLSAPNGKLTSWQIAQRSSHNCLETLVAPLKFDHSSVVADWYDLCRHDEVAIAFNLHGPILILHGGRDFAVVDKDIEHWQRGLKGVPHVRIVNIPGFTHLFLARTGKPNEQEYYLPGHVDHSVIDATATFTENPLAIEQDGWL